METLEAVVYGVVIVGILAAFGWFLGGAVGAAVLPPAAAWVAFG